MVIIKFPTLLYRSISLIIIVVGLILSFLSFFEFYNVSVLKNIKEYPFGSEGPVAGLWQYENAVNYSNFNFISGLLWLLVSFLNVFSLIKSNDRLINFSIFFGLVV